jgi:hypothetical protein
MRLSDAIVAMKDENTCLEVLTGCQCYFDKIEEISGLFANGGAETQTEVRKILSECTSIFLALNPLLALADTEKSNREVIYYHSRKIAIEKTDVKFVATAMDKEASAHVANYRRVRNILEGYIDTLKIAIGTCQSSLRSLSEETRLVNPTQA